MKRDNDFIRELLFKYEAEDEWMLFMPGSTLEDGDEGWRERYYVFLLMDEGLITYVGEETIRLTSYGHDFIEAVRDDTIWNKTKTGVTKAGGASMNLVFEIASAYVKQKASEIVGMPL